MKDEKEAVPYVDEKADAIPNFKVLANLMWNKAYRLLPVSASAGKALNILDPCMGGGKLLCCMSAKDQATGYEKDYKRYTYAKVLEQEKGDVTLINEPFEFKFSSASFPTFDLAISIPYTDSPINAEYEKDAAFLGFKNYAFYIIARSMDAIFDDGIGVFAVPVSLMEEERFRSDRELLLKKCEVIVNERYENYAIIAVKKLI